MNEEQANQLGTKVITIDDFTSNIDMFTLVLQYLDEYSYRSFIVFVDKPSTQVRASNSMVYTSTALLFSIRFVRVTVACPCRA